MTYVFKISVNVVVGNGGKEQMNLTKHAILILQNVKKMTHIYIKGINHESHKRAVDN